MAKTFDLTGVWCFQPDPSAEGERNGFHLAAYDDARWRQVWVPGCFDASPALEAYEGYGWYRRALDIPEDWQGRRIVLRFLGVHYHAEVWVNGQPVGRHGDGFLPFDLDITAAVSWDGPNVLAVRTDNIRRAGEVPGLERGWRTVGGLQRRVELYSTGDLYLGALTATAVLDGSEGRLSLCAGVHNSGAAAGQVHLHARVLDDQGREVACLRSPATPIAGEGCVSFSLEGTVPDVTSWSPATPVLYQVAVTLSDDHGLVEERTLRTGFRHIEARDGQLLLNGKPLYLTGFNRHEDTSAAAMAEDLSTARRDLQQMQAAGANFVRLCHYPHHPDELDLCDELGLLVMDEIPLYWWRGDAEGEGMAAHKLEAAERQLVAMIARDRHHPSVIFWSVSNETDEQRPEVAEGNRYLVQVARTQDPSRLAVHVSNHWRDDPHFEADDVLCVNGYPSLERRGLNGDPTYDLAVSTAFWREGLAALHARYPARPILVAEFGYAALEGGWGQGLGEDVQAQALEAEFKGMDAPYVCGATVWCWADHAWPANVFTYCHGLATSPYGVVSRDRRPKAALDTVRRLFRGRQGTQAPPPAAPEWGAAGYALYMVRPDLADIPDVRFPDGYGIRAIRPNEGGLWIDVQRDAEPYLTIEDDLFGRAFGRNPHAIPWRCFFVTDERGIAVGTISAWFNDDYHGEPWGQVHWVAIRPAHRRRGLARAALAHTLRQLARWHDRAYLGTQSKREAAIRLYLDMGFVPDLRHPGALQAWRAVAQRIEHPALQRLDGHPSDDQDMNCR